MRYLLFMISSVPFKPSHVPLDSPDYSLGDLVKVTRLPVGTVRMWLERKVLQLGPNDVDASGKGSSRLFTLRTVYLAATMAEISRLGVSPSQAAKWAHLIWRTGVERVITDHENMVFVGNPNSDRFRIASRGSLSDEVIFDDSSATDVPELSVVAIDISGVVRKCREALGLQNSSPTPRLSRD